jgi:hypothetical protein
MLKHPYTLVSCYTCMSLNYHLMHTLDHVQVEPESEIQEEQVQKEYDGPPIPSCMGANIVCEQGKPRCIPPKSLTFPLIQYLH